MKLWPRTTKARFWTLFATVLVALILSRIPRVREVVAIQDALQRKYEISFWSDNIPGADRPSLLPVALDTAAAGCFDKLFARTYGSTNYQIVYHERFRALFRGPLRDVHIYYPEAFQGDKLGAALLRLPELRHLTVKEVDPSRPTEADWKLLFTRLRSAPNLETLDIGGDRITEDALTPLAGHPHLQSITIEYSRLTPACARLFSSMPRLKLLHIDETVYDGDSWLTPAQAQAMAAALPGVTLELP
jgi:hypothetical protein